MHHELDSMRLASRKKFHDELLTKIGRCSKFRNCWDPSLNDQVRTPERNNDDSNALNARLTHGRWREKAATMTVGVLNKAPKLRNCSPPGCRLPRALPSGIRQQRLHLLGKGSQVKTSIQDLSRPCLGPATTTSPVLQSDLQCYFYPIGRPQWPISLLEAH